MICINKAMQGIYIAQKQAMGWNVFKNNSAKREYLIKPGQGWILVKIPGQECIFYTNQAKGECITLRIGQRWISYIQNRPVQYILRRPYIFYGTWDP